LETSNFLFSFINYNKLKTMNKKILAGLGAIALLSTSIVFAETEVQGKPVAVMATSASSTMTKEEKAAQRAADMAKKIACVGTAVNTREASLDQAIATHTKAVSDAYGVRALALKDAYTATTSKQLNANVKAAWKAFDTSMKDAQKSWKSSKDTAWATYKTAAIACKAPAGTGDAMHATDENGAH
jgi:hypothetical protein